MCSFVYMMVFVILLIRVYMKLFDRVELHFSG